MKLQVLFYESRVDVHGNGNVFLKYNNPLMCNYKIFYNLLKVALMDFRDLITLLTLHFILKYSQH